MSRPVFRRTAAGSLIGLAAAAFLPAGAHAQPAPDAWQWELGLYGWFPALGGTTEFPSGAGGPTIDISADTLIDALEFAFAGNFGGKKGEWGFWTDVFYADVSGSKDGIRDFTLGHHELPASLTADLTLDVKTTIWTLVGSYELVKSPANTTDVVAGARMLRMNQTLDWVVDGDIAGTGLPGHSGSKDLNVTNWDAVVGIKGVAFPTADRKWFLPYYVDVGAGQSKFTWQFAAGVGYRFDWGSIVATWRYTDYEMKSGEPVRSIDFNGPTIGAVFRF